MDVHKHGFLKKTHKLPSLVLQLELHEIRYSRDL